MSVLLTSAHDGPNGDAATSGFYANPNVSDSGVGQAIFSTDHDHGGRAVRYDGTDQWRTFRYVHPAGVVDKMAWRGYYYFESTPAANYDFFRFFNSVTGNQVAALGISSAGLLRVKEGNTTRWTSANSIVGTPSRIEIKYRIDTLEVRARLWLGANIENVAGTPDEDSDPWPMLLEPNGADQAIWGWIQTNPNRYHLDDIALHDDQVAFIGPVAGSAPSAAFTVSPTSGDAPLTITVTDTSTGAPTSWVWDWGDAEPDDTTQNATHEYAAAGTYTVTLTATNANGSTSATAEITVTEPTVGTVPVEVWENAQLNTRTGAQRQVRVGGTLETIVTINGVTDVTPDPDPDPDPTARFPGDPGVGKCYIGSNRPGDTPGLNTEDEKITWVREKMSLWDSTTETKRTRRPRLYRSYMGPGSAGTANQPDYDWTHPERANNRMISRRLVQYAHDDKAIPWVEINVREIGQPGDSTTDAWMDNLAAAYDKELGDLSALNAAEQTAIDEVTTIASHCMQYAPNPIWLSLDHEPEDNITPAQTARLTRFRKAQRAIILWMRREGVTNVANVACTYMTMTVRAQGGRDWRTWYPDWKGTSTGGATPLNPFPGGSTSDFWTNNTKEGDMNESVVDIVGHDIYFWDWEWEATASIAHADTFDTVMADAGWSADHDRALALGIHRANRLGKPWAIGEIGTQAAGYLDSSGTLVQRPKDITSLRNLGLDLSASIERGELVGIAYFNTYEHTWGRKNDPNYSKAIPMVELFDKYNVVPPIA